MVIEKNSFIFLKACNASGSLKELVTFLKRNYAISEYKIYRLISIFMHYNLIYLSRSFNTNKKGRANFFQESVISSIFHFKFKAVNPSKYRIQEINFVVVDEANCIDCGECTTECPTYSLLLVNGELVFDACNCVLCGACCNACKNGYIYCG